VKSVCSNCGGKLLHGDALGVCARCGHVLSSASWALPPPPPSSRARASRAGGARLAGQVLAGVLVGSVAGIAVLGLMRADRQHDTASSGAVGAGQGELGAGGAGSADLPSLNR